MYTFTLIDIIVIIVNIGSLVGLIYFAGWRVALCAWAMVWSETLSRWYP